MGLKGLRTIRDACARHSSSGWTRLITALVLILAPSLALAAPPNILLVIGDDVGFPFYGFMDHPVVKTPVLDSLAAAGTVFPVAYTTSSLCRPSLPGILTGLHPKDFPLDRGRRLAASAPTIARLLQQAGYASLHTGKTWPGAMGDHELSFGFTAVDGLSEHRIGRSTMQPIFDFIDGAGAFEGTGPRPGQPWFIWYAPFIPHTPHRPPPWAFDLYSALDLKGNDRSYYGAISQLDGTVGEILSFLESRNQRNNTVVIYLSDNGYHLRHSKGAWSENGYRTPILISDPRKQGAGTRPEMAHAIDLLPTILDYAGVPMPAGPFEGMSLRPLSEGKTVPWRKYLVGHHTPQMSNGRPLRHVRSQDGFKLYAKCGGKPKLYDVIATPEERNGERLNIKDYPDRVAELEAVLDAWWDPCGAKAPAEQ